MYIFEKIKSPSFLTFFFESEFWVPVWNDWKQKTMQTVCLCPASSVRQKYRFCITFQTFSRLGTRRDSFFSGMISELFFDFLLFFWKNSNSSLRPKTKIWRHHVVLRRDHSFFVALPALLSQFLISFSFSSIPFV